MTTSRSRARRARFRPCRRICRAASPGEIAEVWWLRTRPERAPREATCAFSRLPMRRMRVSREPRCRVIAHRLSSHSGASAFPAARRVIQRARRVLPARLAGDGGTEAARGPVRMYGGAGRFMQATGSAARTANNWSRSARVSSGTWWLKVSGAKLSSGTSRCSPASSFRWYRPLVSVTQSRKRSSTLRTQTVQQRPTTRLAHARRGWLQEWPHFPRSLDPGWPH